jgi:hypothetical protein
MSLHELANAPSLAIVIVNWNSYTVTEACLLSLRSLDYTNFETIVVDNGSEDDSVKQLSREFPEVTLLEHEDNRGFTGGNNTGIQYALDQGKDLIMLLNNDTIVTSDFASILIEALLVDNSIGAIQPKIMYNQEREIIWSAGGFMNFFFFTTRQRGLNENDLGQYNEPSEVEWVTGCCFLTRSEIVREVGLLDNKYFIYFEDGDWSFRVKAHGYRLMYEPRSVIYHEVGKSNENRKGHNEGNISPFTRYQSVRNHLFFVRRYAKGINKIGSWVNQFFKIGGYLGYYLLRGRFQKFKIVIRAVIDGLTL